MVHNNENKASSSVNQKEKKINKFNEPGFNISSVSFCRLNGSVLEFKRCLKMTDRSIMVPLGSSTGSNITVSINGSKGKMLS